MTSSETLRLKVRLARQSKNITQQEAAKRIGVSLRTLQRLESGKTPYDVSTLYQFCHSFNFNFLELTHPQISPESCNHCEFFQTEGELLSQSSVASEDMAFLKEEVLILAKSSPENFFSGQSYLETINSVKTPTLLANTQTTVANRALRKLNTHYDEKKWKTASKFESPLSFINALDISLKNNFKGFKVTNFLESGLSFEKFYLLLKEDSFGPIALAQVI